MSSRKLTEEEKRLFNERRKKTCMERYGDPNYNNFKKAMGTKEVRYGDKNYNNLEKHKQTCEERFGVSHHNLCKLISEKISAAKKSQVVQQKYESTMMQRYGSTNVNDVPEIRERYTKTLMKNYGVTNPLKNKDIYNKHIDTMKTNGSFKKSKPEEDYYAYLCETYGQDDIIRLYSDERYPFNCDFYIKSKDMFIEINFHPSHGDHPFDCDNPEDIKQLEELKLLNTPWSNLIIDVWTERDTKKLETAKKNNLNYKVIYKN